MMATLDVSAILGLIALVGLCADAWLGLAIWARIKVRVGRVTPFGLHKWTGYAAAITVGAHVVLIPLDPRSKFSWADLALPLWTEHQPVANTLGAVALWLLAIVVVSSYFLKRLGFQRWRKLHYLAFVAIPVLLVHGVVTDPALRDQPIDFLDAEKLLVEGAALLFMVAVFIRLRLRGRKPRARGNRSHAVAIILGILFVPGGARADGSESDGPAQGWSLDPDAGAVWTRGGWTYTTWGFAQGVVWDGEPYWRRARQGMLLLSTAIGGVRATAVYEVDLTDNDFFRLGPGWKIFENAFIGVQNAESADRFRVLYGENTHVLSREDNQSSGNLPTINRSMILESHGSVHAFGTQWGGQLRGTVGHGVLLTASMGDNTGSLNQEHPHFGVANDFGGKASAPLWKNAADSRLAVGAAGDYTRHSDDPAFILASSLGNAPLLRAPVGGARVSGEVDAELILRGHALPLQVETEWIASRFAGTGTIALGGYVQGLAQLYDSRCHGDLSVFVRPEFARLSSNGAAAATLAVRAGLDWNVPVTAQRANVLLEGAWHRSEGAADVLVAHGAVWELRLMLRVSLTRHARF